jgi:hypothetical protein
LLFREPIAPPIRQSGRDVTVREGPNDISAGWVTAASKMALTLSDGDHLFGLGGLLHTAQEIAHAVAVVIQIVAAAS